MSPLPSSPHIIEFAIRAANASPCAKSKRGVVIFDRDPVRILGGGHNEKPGDLTCDGSAQCRFQCRRVCVHAEQYALRNMWQRMVTSARHGEIYQPDVSRLHMVHVKTVGGVLVPGGGPSCEQCSKLILDAGLAGMWLYERTFSHDHDDGSPGSVPVEVAPEWRFYTAVEFHRETLKNLGLHHG